MFSRSTPKNSTRTLIQCVGNCWPMVRYHVCLVLLVFSTFARTVDSNQGWDDWWAYNGISGPNFWGRMRTAWSLCSHGRRQSPIDIQPELLLFDPILPPLQIIGHHVNGNLINTGRGITFKLSGLGRGTTTQASPTAGSGGSSSSVEEADPPPVVISLGPLSYRYTLHHLTLHYGREITRGSEHTINGHQFPGELQLYGYNSQLYGSWDEAVQKAHGIAAIAVLIQISSDPRLANNQLKRVTHALKNITAKGNSQRISSLSISDLIPRATRRQYITYEGSLTTPGCHETVQWIVLNKPIYMTSHLFHSLRQSLGADASHGADNYRPIQKINGRSVRTNIDFRQPGQPEENNDVEYENFEHFDGHVGISNGPTGITTSQDSGGSTGGASTGGSNHPKTSSKKETCSMKRPVVYRANVKNHQDTTE